MVEQSLEISNRKKISLERGTGYRRNFWTKEKVLEESRIFVSTYGSISAKLLIEHNRLDLNAQIRLKFGGMVGLKVAIGQPHRYPNGYWSKERIINLLDEAYEKHGELSFKTLKEIGHLGIVNHISRYIPDGITSYNQQKLHDQGINITKGDTGYKKYSDKDGDWAGKSYIMETFKIGGALFNQIISSGQVRTHNLKNNNYNLADIEKVINERRSLPSVNKDGFYIDPEGRVWGSIRNLRDRGLVPGKPKNRTFLNDLVSLKALGRNGSIVDLYNLETVSLYQDKKPNTQLSQAQANEALKDLVNY